MTKLVDVVIFLSFLFELSTRRAYDPKTEPLTHWEYEVGIICKNAITAEMTENMAMLLRGLIPPANLTKKEIFASLCFLSFRSLHFALIQEH